MTKVERININEPILYKGYQLDNLSGLIAIRIKI